MVIGLSMCWFFLTKGFSWASIPSKRFVKLPLSSTISFFCRTLGVWTRLAFLDATLSAVYVTAWTMSPEANIIMFRRASDYSSCRWHLETSWIVCCTYCVKLSQILCTSGLLWWNEKRQFNDPGSGAVVFLVEFGKS